MKIAFAFAIAAILMAPTIFSIGQPAAYAASPSVVGTPSSATVSNSMTVQFCSVSATPSTLSFGTVAPSTPTPASSPVTVTNTGNEAADFYVYGSNWQSGTTDVLSFADTQVTPSLPAPPSPAPVSIGSTAPGTHLATAVAGSAFVTETFDVDITDFTTPISPVPATPLSQTMTFAVSCP